MTAAKENADDGKPTDRYQKVAPEEDGSRYSGDRTPLATEIPDVEGEPLPGDSPEDAADGSEDAPESAADTPEDAADTPERAVGTPEVPPARGPAHDLLPRKTQRYDPLFPEDASRGRDLDTTPGAPAGDSPESQSETPIHHDGAANLEGDYDPLPTPVSLGHEAERDSTPPDPSAILAGGADETPPGGVARGGGADPGPGKATAARASGRSDPLIGKMVGGVVIEEVIGRGGMGSIYRGRHPHLRKDFALKILPDRLALLPPFVERFINEGRAAARITHPGAVRVSAAGVEGGIHFIVMELIQGRDLRRIVEEKGALHEFDVRRILVEAARVLAAAHGVGIIHRDIKPENLLLENTTNRVRVTDFGLSMDTSADLASVEATIGTPNYMSPEQCMGRGCDERSDIYALGATCYYLLTRRPPFTGHTATAVMIRHIVEKAPDPRVYAPRTTDEFAEIVLRMMAKDPRERFASAVELAQAVEALRDHSGTPPTARAGDGPGSREARLTRLLVEAQERRAESVHLVVEPASAEVSLRVDGALIPHGRLGAEEGRGLADTIKAAAGIPPGAGSPRHGRFDVDTQGGASVPVFVGVLPAAASERLVLRFLPVIPDYAFTRERLGLSPEQDRQFADWAERSRGVVLASGELEGGTSSLLYGLIAQIRHRPVAAVTIEAQVDVLFDGVTQFELDPASGLTQETTLRACLDQDVDVCMITDVQPDRWVDVFEAARAGRLMLASGTRPDGISLLRQLLEVGVPLEHIDELCLAAVTSREIPLACGDCGASLALEPHEMAALGLPAGEPVVVSAPSGCKVCGQTGTFGRELVHEVLTPNRGLLRALAAGSSDSEVRDLAAEQGATVPLRAILCERVLSGRTRVQDAMRALEELR